MSIEANKIDAKRLDKQDRFRVPESKDDEASNPEYFNIEDEYTELPPNVEAEAWVETGIETGKIDIHSAMINLSESLRKLDSAKAFIDRE